MRIVPIGRDDANDFVEQHHRHNRRVPGCKFCLAVATDDGTVLGVAIVGRPVARGSDDGFTLEVNRVCVAPDPARTEPDGRTHGYANVGSMLYGACRRVAKEMGYRKILTYTLVEESGSSLRAVGWRCEGLRGARSWNTPTRPRVDRHTIQERLCWTTDLA